VSALRYQSHTIVKGKPDLPGLPATFGSEKDATTLVVHLYDEHSKVEADLLYSIFPEHDAIVRSAKVTNKGDAEIVIEKLASLSVDFPFDMVSLWGDHLREATIQRRKVESGIQR
jgi:alpha-galactosidase